MNKASLATLGVLAVVVAAWAVDRGASDPLTRGITPPSGEALTSACGDGTAASGPVGCLSTKPATGCCSSSQPTTADACGLCCCGGAASQPATSPAKLPPGDANSPDYWFALAAGQMDALPDQDARDELSKLMGIARADAGDLKGAVAQADKVGEDQRGEILSSVILAEAKNGNVAEIKAVAERIPDGRVHDNAVYRAVSVLCDKGRLAEANQIASVITDKVLRSRSYCLIAKKQALSGHMDEAKATVQLVSEERFRGYMPAAIAKIESLAASKTVTDRPEDNSETDSVQEILTGLAAARARDGHLEEAMKFAGRQESCVQRSLAYTAIAERKAEGNDKAGADKAFGLAQEAAEQDTDALAKAIAFGATAAARMKIGDTEGAKKSIQDALKANPNDTEGFRLEVGSFYASGRPALVGLRLKLGDIQEALAMAKTPDGDYAGMDCYLVGLSLSEAGRTQELANWLPMVSNPTGRAYAYVGVASGLLVRQQAPPKGP